MRLLLYSYSCDTCTVSSSKPSDEKFEYDNVVATRSTSWTLLCIIPDVSYKLSWAANIQGAGELQVRDDKGAVYTRKSIGTMLGRLQVLTGTVSVLRSTPIEFWFRRLDDTEDPFFVHKFSVIKEGK